MQPAFAQREIALAAVALLSVLVGLAIASGRGEPASGQRLPARVPAPGGGWYHAAAAASGRDLEAGKTACGIRLSPTTMGIAHPVLPCGVKLYIGYGDEEVLTQVIARGPEQRGVQFGLTQALARTLGIEGTVTIRWSYAR